MVETARHHDGRIVTEDSRSTEVDKEPNKFILYEIEKRELIGVVAAGTLKHVQGLVIHGICIKEGCV